VSTNPLAFPVNAAFGAPMPGAPIMVVHLAWVSRCRVVPCRFGLFLVGIFLPSLLILTVLFPRVLAKEFIDGSKYLRGQLCLLSKFISCRAKISGSAPLSS